MHTSSYPSPSHKGLARHPEHGLVLHINIKAVIVVLVTTQKVLSGRHRGPVS